MSADSRFATVMETAAAAVEACHVPGMAVGVLVMGKCLTEGLGVTDPRAPLGVDADTLFQIGSISKTFAGTLAALLAQRGRLDLDAPLTEYLPEFRVADADTSKRVTPRNLLSHNAGWLGDHFEMDTHHWKPQWRACGWMPQLYPLGESLVVQQRRILCRRPTPGSRRRQAIRHADQAGVSRSAGHDGHRLSPD